MSEKFRTENWYKTYENYDRLSEFDKAVVDEHAAKRAHDLARAKYYKYRYKINGTDNTDPKYVKLRDRVHEAAAAAKRREKRIAELWDD